MRGLTRRRRSGSGLGQHATADVAGQVDHGGRDDVGGLGEQVAGGVEGDGETAPVGIDAAAASIASVMAMRRI
jgi:hypothetical protein